MATFYLINNVVMGTSQRYAGEYVDDALEATAGITAAGGILLASGLTGLATAAGIAQSMKKRGAEPAVLEGIMQSAVAQYGVDFMGAHDTVDNATATNNTTALTTDGTALTSDGTTAVTNAMLFTGTVHYKDPIAAELITIVADVLIADGAQIIAAQPDAPRKLQIRITDADTSITAGDVTIVGVGPGGQAETEVVSIASVGTATLPTVNAYTSVTSITVAGLVGNGVGDNISVGVGAALGLPIPVGATAVTVYRSYVDNVSEAIGVVDATARTIAPTTPADAAKDFDFFFSYSMAATQAAHTHTVAAHTHTVAAHGHTQNAHTHTLS